MYAAGLTLFHMEQGYKQGDLSLLCLTLVSSAGPHEWEAFALWTFSVSCRGHASSRSATNRRGNESRRGSRQHRKAQTDRPTGSPLAGPSFLFLNGYDSGRCVETFQFLSRAIGRAGCLLLVCHVHALLQPVSNFMEARRLRHPRAEENVLQQETTLFFSCLCEVEVESAGEKTRGKYAIGSDTKLLGPPCRIDLFGSAAGPAAMVSTLFSIPKDFSPFSLDTRTSLHNSLL